MTPKHIAFAGLAAVSICALFYAFQAAGPETKPPQSAAQKTASTAGAGSAGASATTNVSGQASTPPGAGADANGSLSSSTGTGGGIQPPGIIPPSPSTITPAPPRDAAAKQVVMDKIETASTTYDPASLPQIRPFLYDGDREVRAAALNGIVNLGSAAGAPLLREAAKAAPTSQEAIELLSKADYLELPSAPITAHPRKPGSPAPKATPNFFVRPKAK